MKIKLPFPRPKPATKPKGKRSVWRWVVWHYLDGSVYATRVPADLDGFDKYFASERDAWREAAYVLAERAERTEFQLTRVLSNCEVTE